ncbi:MAG: hypothetical protein ABJF50_10825 [Paracoccaceae bacterium]
MENAIKSHLNQSNEASLEISHKAEALTQSTTDTKQSTADSNKQLSDTIDI